MATAMTLLNSCVFLLFPLSVCLTPPLFSLVCRSGRSFPPLHTCAITSPVAYHLISFCFKTLVSPPSIASRISCSPVFRLPVSHVYHYQPETVSKHQFCCHQLWTVICFSSPDLSLLLPLN